MVAVRQPDFPHRWVSTGEWDALVVPEHYRAEVIRGELVLSPSPSRIHQRCVVNLTLLLVGSLQAGGWDDTHEVLPDLEWRRDEHGCVAQAPRPDLMVVPRGADAIADPPLLLVEILSPSDFRRLEDSDLQRIEGKVLDYTDGGARYYLEVYPDEPAAFLYDLFEAKRLVAAARGDEQLHTMVPFPFWLRPSGLV